MVSVGDPEGEEVGDSVREPVRDGERDKDPVPVQVAVGTCEALPVGEVVSVRDSVYEDRGDGERELVPLRDCEPVAAVNDGVQEETDTLRERECQLADCVPEGLPGEAVESVGREGVAVGVRLWVPTVAVTVDREGLLE